MTAASLIIGKFGGVRKTSRALGINASTVCRWNRTKEDGGTDGRIPQKHFKQIMAIFPEVTLEQLVFGAE